MNERELGREVGRTLMKGRDVSSLMFVHLAQNEEFDDVTITEHFDLFPVWTVDWTGKVGSLVQDEGQLYRKVNVDFNTPYPSSKPSTDASQWKLVGDPGEEYPEWSQPLGAHDAYQVGDKVTYNGKKWVCKVGNNIYAPGVVAGQWEEVIS